MIFALLSRIALRSWRGTSQRVVTTAGLTAGLLLAGCAQFGADESMQDADVAIPPSAIVLPAFKLMPAAEALAEHQPNGFIVMSDTDDMLPRYARGTAFVATRGSYRNLQRGMIVVVQKPDGERVARQLVKKARGGWITLALNTQIQDPEPMTEATYVGTVTLAFSPERTT